MLRCVCILVSCLAVTIMPASGAPPSPRAAGEVRVASPSGRNQVTVELRDGRLYWSLTRDGRALILPSLLGFELRGGQPLRDGLRIADTARQSHDEW